MCGEGGFCGFWNDKKMVGDFADVMKFPCTKRECVYCRYKIPGHWSGRYNIFLSFLTCVVWILMVHTVTYILFTLFFLTSDDCEAAFLQDGYEQIQEDVANGEPWDGEEPSTPSPFGEIVLALMWLILGGLLAYTGYWAFETRNITWQVLWLVLQLLYFVWQWREMVHAFRYASICNALFAINGILYLGMIASVGHTVVFGCLTYMRRLEAPKATHGLGSNAGPTASAVASPVPGAPIAPAVPVDTAAAPPMPVTVPVPVAQVTKVGADPAPLARP